MAHANNLVLVKFEVKVRAGLNIARTSSSVDLTAGLGRDELGWLPPRLTFDADGRSAGEGRLRRPVCDSTASVSRLLNASLDPATLSACTCKRGKF